MGTSAHRDLEACTGDDTVTPCRAAHPRSLCEIHQRALWQRTVGLTGALKITVRRSQFHSRSATYLSGSAASRNDWQIYANSEGTSGQPVRGLKAHLHFR